MAECKASTLVAGGAGFVGSHVVLALLDAGHRVVVIDNLSGGLRWAVDSRAVFFEGDIQNESLVRAIMEMHRVGSIVQCAGTNPVAEVSGDPLEFYRNNTSATRSLIESGIACGVGTFLYSSTAETCALHCPAAVPEAASQQPAQAYAVSKRVVERILADTSAVHRLNHGVLRYFNAVGADPLGRSGQVHPGAAHMVKLAVETVMGLHDDVEVPETKGQTADGSPIRDYVHVSDLALAHAVMLDALLADPERSLALNCSYGRGYSDLEVLEAAERVTNVRIARRSAPLPAGEPPVLVADGRAIRETLGWKPRHDNLEQMVRDSYDWQMRLPRLVMRQAEGAMTTAVVAAQVSHKAVR